MYDMTWFTFRFSMGRENYSKRREVGDEEEGSGEARGRGSTQKVFTQKAMSHIGFRSLLIKNIKENLFDTAKTITIKGIKN